ncbi:unnamed protein product, partial [Vitis vinifera]
MIRVWILKARILEGLLEMRLDRAQLILLVVGHWALWEPMQIPSALLANISRRQIKCLLNCWWLHRFVSGRIESRWNLAGAWFCQVKSLTRLGLGIGLGLAVA